jgi:hypothetical protein
MRRSLVTVLLGVMSLSCPHLLPAGTPPVRYGEGLVRGFLSLSTLEGKPLAYGDLIQSARGDRVTRRLVFHFKDGSVHDETVVYTQHQTFRLLKDHVIQKGPAFRHPMDFSLDATTGQVTVHYQDGGGNEKVATKRLALPADIANGLVLTLIKNIGAESGPITVSMVAATPEPLLIKLRISLAGEEPFAIGSSQRTAMHYVVRAEIGGVAGVVAPLIGKQPADTHVWILSGDAPAFLKAEGPLAADGPAWRIELASPVWPPVAKP